MYDQSGVQNGGVFSRDKHGRDAYNQSNVSWCYVKQFSGKSHCIQSKIYIDKYVDISSKYCIFHVAKQSGCACCHFVDVPTTESVRQRLPNKSVYLFVASDAKPIRFPSAFFDPINYKLTLQPDSCQPRDTFAKLVIGQRVSIWEITRHSQRLIFFSCIHWIHQRNCVNIPLYCFESHICWYVNFYSI